MNLLLISFHVKYMRTQILYLKRKLSISVKMNDILVKESQLNIAYSKLAFLIGAANYAKNAEEA